MLSKFKFHSLLKLHQPIKNPNKTLHFLPPRTITITMSSWSCSKCTFLNPSSQKFTCQMCLTPSTTTTTTTFSSSSTLPTWVCKACTFLNSYSRSNCAICDTRATNTSFLTALDIDDDMGEPSASVGSVFFPLRRCSTTQIDDLYDDSGFQDEVPMEVGMDDFVEKSVPVGGSRGSKRKFEDPIKDDKVRNVRSERASASTQIVENADVKKGPGTIKILSYNIWFNEELEAYKRMQAIGDLIQLHSPDIICFQEVTANLYLIFQRSTWWKNYRCSVSFDRAASEVYFCVQLSKLPVKSFSREQFSYTKMGRELCIAQVEVKENKSLVIATSHLESPCPGPPKWDQMYSKERVNQAKEAISFLQQYPNVIFCGDMNWDDKLDGRFPFTDGWFDAWERLRPAEVGWTYDTKTNKTLSGNRTLQKRLDRFICHLPDFEICSIDMIGTEAIPGLTYKKEKKNKAPLTLPVLPSDHYGLLLTITAK